MWTDKLPPFWKYVLTGCIVFGCILVIILFAYGILEISRKIAAVDCPLSTGQPNLKGCDAKDLAKATNDVRSSILQILVGIAGGVAIYFTWRTYALGREGRVSDNFIKAVDQLGSKVVHVRVGGIFGLGRLLRTATVWGDYWPLMETLTAFVRQSAPVTGKLKNGKRPEDVQAAVDVLTRRSYRNVPRREGNSPVDLSATDLSGLWMPDAHFEQGFFQDSEFVASNLTSAKLHNANFGGANLSYANFSRASVVEANLDDVKAICAKFNCADLSHSSFTRADLTGTCFERAVLTGVSFDGAVIKGADFTGCNLSADQLSKTSYDATTKLPSSLRGTSAGSKKN